MNENLLIQNILLDGILFEVLLPRTFDKVVFLLLFPTIPANFELQNSDPLLIGL